MGKKTRDMLKLNIPDSKTLPYWLAFLAFSAAAFAFGGWINAEQRCAEREREVIQQSRAEIEAAIKACEKDKQEALRELRSFIKESSDRYATLARETNRRKK